MKTVYGYDGNGYQAGDRVEFHPGTDLWMRGSRYGTVLSIDKGPMKRVRVKTDKLGTTYSCPADRLRRV